MLPEGWQEVAIGDLNPYITSGSRGWARYYAEDGDLFVRITNLVRHRLEPDLRDCRYVRLPDGSSEGKRTKLSEGDILVSITADLGITAFIGRAFPSPAYINQHIALIRLRSEIADNKFVAYQLANDRRQFDQLNDAGAKSGLNLESLRRFVVRLPPISEQRAIVELLDTWQTAVDKLAAQIHVMRERKHELMRVLLTGERRFKEFSGCEWRTIGIGDVASCIRGVTYKPNELQESESESTVRLLRANNIRDGSIDLSDVVFVPLKNCRPEQIASTGDIAICMSSGSKDLVGKAAALRSAHSGRYTVGAFCSLLRPHDDDTVDRGFIEQFFQSSLYRRALTSLHAGSSIANLRPSDIEGIKFRVPTLIQEQRRISTVLSTADAEIEVLEKQLEAYRLQKRGLMQQLLSGKKRMRIEGPEVVPA